MKVDISAFVKAYPTYQRFKKHGKKYWEISPKTVTIIPKETVFYLVCPYNIIDKSGTGRILTVMIFVDAVASCFEIGDVPDKSNARINKKIQQYVVGLLLTTIEDHF